MEATASTSASTPAQPSTIATTASTAEQPTTTDAIATTTEQPTASSARPENERGEAATVDYFADAWAQMIEGGAADRAEWCAMYDDERTRSDAIGQLLVSAQSVTSGFEEAQRHHDYIWSDEGVQSAHDQFFVWCPITVPAGHHFETLDELCMMWTQTSIAVPDDKCK